MNEPTDKIKLHGFNNLTKNLSLSIYHICYGQTSVHHQGFINSINTQYSAKALTKILHEVVFIIGAKVLNIATQDYQPQGASVTLLVSDATENEHTIYNDSEHSSVSESLVAHLDKSHICVHTYPEVDNKTGICTVRLDIDVSSCGVISPLKALNYLMHSLACDVATIDYRVRGFTRDIKGLKHYIDHDIESIQDFIAKEIKATHHLVDINMPKHNLFHTKMRKRELDVSSHFIDSNIDTLEPHKMCEIKEYLENEVQEIFTGNN